MIRVIIGLIDWIGRYLTVKELSNDPRVKAIITAADAKAGSLDIFTQQRLKTAIEEKVKSGWSREGAEASALWEADIIDDDEFQILMKALKLDK